MVLGLYIGFVEVDMKKRTKWSDEKIISELELIIKRIGCFPTYTNLLELNRHDLVSSIYRRKGLNRFCRLMGYRIRKNSNGFWTDNIIISNISVINRKLKHFPSCNDLRRVNHGLINAIIINGGINKYRKAFGLKPTNMSLISKHFILRGQFAEYLIDIILDECKESNHIKIIRNKRFSDNSVVEFYLIDNRIKSTASIDVTCTDSYNTIIDKWTNRNYHLFSDLLIIVVFSRFLTNKDYKLLNEICPLNVFVVDVKEFIENLKYNYSNVTEEDINICINYTFDKYMKEIGHGD